MRKIRMDCLPGLSGRLAHLQSSNILITKMKSLLAELNMRYFNSANEFLHFFHSDIHIYCFLLQNIENH